MFAEKQLSKALDWFESCGVTHWNLAALGEVMKASDRPRDRAEMERSIPWAKHENANRSAIYMRPARYMPDGSQASWPVVFFDDVPESVIDRIHTRALIIRTSPGRYHVWMACTKALTEAERKQVQSTMQLKMNSDPGSVSGEHFGRAPGFRNWKRESWVVVWRTIEGPLLPVNRILSTTEAETHTTQARAPNTSSRPGWASESEREFGYVIGRLRWISHHQPSALMQEAERLTSELAERARARGKRKPEAYAARTVRAALARL